MKSKTALLIIHLSSLDAYTAMALELGQSLGDLLADEMTMEILKHQGPVYIVDQGWSLGRRESRPRARIIQDIGKKKVIWIPFDESRDDWDLFEKKLVQVLKKDKVTDVVIGGLWYQKNLESGCVSEVLVRLRDQFKASVNERIVGCEADLV